MSENIFDFVTEASKEQSKLRMAVGGPSGSGKTYSMINIMQEMGCENIVVLDTEHGSAAKYANEFKRKFKVVDNRFWKSNFDPRRLMSALKQLGPVQDGIIVDSLTHFWMGPGGMLSIVDEFAKRAQAKNGKYDSYGAWKHADPIYNDLIQTILSLPCHFAAGLRAKTEYVRSEEGGKAKVQKTGMGLQIREGFEYEFDVEGMLDMEHNFVVGKSRCSAIDGKIFALPGKNIAEPLLVWLTDGVPPATPALPSVPSLVVDEPSPPTTREVPVVSVKAALLAKIATATTLPELKAAAEEVRAALKDKKITNEEYSAEISPAYGEKLKVLKAAAA